MRGLLGGARRGASLEEVTVSGAAELPGGRQMRRGRGCSGAEDSLFWAWSFEG